MASTGPPVPRLRPGDNAIGNFAIGASQIGDIPPFDFWRTVISQYGNSPIMGQLLASYFAALDQTANFQAFFDNIWNIDTAQGFGLDIWGRIVGVPRAITVTPSNQFFGDTQGGFSPFGGSPFFGGSSGSPATQNINLTDDAYRRLILAKAGANIWDGSIAGLNAILLEVYGQNGNAWVIDNLDMSLTWAFDFKLSDLDLAILESGAIPHPTGVLTNIHDNIPAGITWDQFAHGTLTVLSAGNTELTVSGNSLGTIQGARSNWFWAGGSVDIRHSLLASAGSNVMRIGFGGPTAVTFNGVFPPFFGAPTAISMGPISFSAISGQQLSIGGGRLGDDVHGIGYSPLDGNVWLNNAIIATLAAMSVGDPLDTYLDMATRRVWFRVANGLWNGSATANPTLNVGGYDISSIPDAQLFAWADVENTDTTSIISNFYASP